MERQRQIISNREKALARIRQRQRQIKNTNSSTSTKRPLESSSNAVVTSNSTTNTTANRNSSLNKKPRLELTPEQKALIEKNRQKALERRRLREGLVNGNLRDASSNLTGNTNTTERGTAQSSNGDGVRVAPTKMSDGEQQKTLRPMFKMSDYIEYDFSKMTDTYGGFLADNPNGEPQGKSLEEWKDEQQNRSFMDEAPPLDLANAPRCFECNSIELDPKLLQVFGCRVCKKCREEKPEKYSLLTKTECKADYFLTEPELEDEALFKRIVKSNPHSGTFSKMQLFLRYQIEEYAFKKWGSADDLDNEWLRREEMRIKRKESRFNKRLGEMRKKLRAEEITRKLRGGKGDKHIHDWNEPVRVQGDEPNLFKRRCKDCGVEVEEIKF